MGTFSWLRGEELAAGALPAGEFPGRKLPGRKLPGRELPGRELLAREHPMEEIPGGGLMRGELGGQNFFKLAPGFAGDEL